MYQKTVKTLDLSAFVEKTFDVTLLDGTTIQLKRPTKAIALKLQQLKEFDKDDKSPEAEEAFKQLITDILYSAFNNNLNKKEVPIETIQEMSDGMLIAVTGEYFKFLNEVMQNPNSESLPYQEKPKRKGTKRQK